MEFKLTRLPDVNGRVNWILSRPENIHPEYNNLSRAYIDLKASELEIGETKIINL